MKIKVLWKKLGGHIHVRVFQGQGEGFPWQKNGDLVFDQEGFDVFLWQNGRRGGMGWEWEEDV